MYKLAELALLLVPSAVVMIIVSIKNFDKGEEEDGNNENAGNGNSGA